MDDYYRLFVGLGIGAGLIAVCAIPLFSYSVLENHCEWWQHVRRAFGWLSDLIARLPLWAGAVIWLTIPIWGPLMFLVWATFGLLLAAPLAGWMLSKYLRGEQL